MKARESGKHLRKWKRAKTNIRLRTLTLFEPREMEAMRMERPTANKGAAVGACHDYKATWPRDSKEATLQLPVNKYSLLLPFTKLKLITWGYPPFVPP